MKNSVESRDEVKEKIESSIKEIKEEILTIEEEGFLHNRNWYALDRLQEIRDICDRVLNE